MVASTKSSKTKEAVRIGFNCFFFRLAETLDGVQTYIDLAEEQEWAGKWGTSFGVDQKSGKLSKLTSKEKKKLN